MFRFQFFLTYLGANVLMSLALLTIALTGALVSQEEASRGLITLVGLTGLSTCLASFKLFQLIAEGSGVRNIARLPNGYYATESAFFESDGGSRISWTSVVMCQRTKQVYTVVSEHNLLSHFEQRGGEQYTWQPLRDKKDSELVV